MSLPKQLFMLSHLLDTSTPAYGGGTSFSRRSLVKPTAGKSSQSEEWTFKNHLGTHIDFPLHFIPNGKSLSSYKAEDFYFEKTYLIECLANEDQILRPEDFNKLPANDCELLLIRTGFEKYRVTEAYWKNNPGIHPSVAEYLIRELPNLRAIAFDFISLTSYQNRELGREAHKAFLGGSKEILIIEDAHLLDCPSDSLSVVVAPLLVNHADGSPVTMLGFK